MQQTKLAIIGSGPAGYTAGLYAARAQLAPVLFAGVKNGGQLMYTTDVENYPGFPEGKNGPELMMEMRKQAEKFGTQIIDKFVTGVDFSSRPFKLWTNFPQGANLDDLEKAKPEEIQTLITQVKQQPHEYETESAVVTTGAVSILLGVPGESEFLGKGVSTCAVCDAAFFKDKTTFVVGGGDAAMEDALALTKFASSVTILHRRDQFRASKIMQDRVLNHDKIRVMWNSTLEEVWGDDKVNKIRVKENGQDKELPAEGVFIAIGHRPMTDIFQGQLNLDEHGYVITRQSFTRAGVEAAQAAIDDKGLLKFPTMTSVEGVFAAGDVVDVRYKQAITAAGQGCSAALDAERWIESQGR